MGIDAVGDVLGAVAQDELYDLLVDIGVGQERRAGVPAVVGQVVHRSQYGRSLPKMVAQPVIISDRPAVGVDDQVLVFRVVHGGDEGLDLVGQGDDPVPAGRRFHAGPEIVVGQVYIFRSGPQELRRAQTRIDVDEGQAGAVVVGVLPQRLDFRRGKGLMQP